MIPVLFLQMLAEQKQPYESVKQANLFHNISQGKSVSKISHWFGTKYLFNVKKVEHYDRIEYLWIVKSEFLSSFCSSLYFLNWVHGS